MQKIRFFIIFLYLITSFILPIFSASVSGVIYDENINPLKGAIVKIEKDQALYSQIITEQTGNYQFSLPTGDYNLTASVKERNQTLQTSVALKLSENTSIVIDLLLLPELGAEIPEIVTPTEEEEFPSMAEETLPITPIFLGFVIILIIAVIFVVYSIWKKQAEQEKVQKKQAEETKREIEEIKRKKEEPPLGRFLTDEEKIYQMVQRMKEVPQKHIVIETGFSKAKVTLILKKLEKIGKIKRTSTGREKIIKPVE